MDAKITDAYLQTFPTQFHLLHQYADFRALYEKAIEVSGLRNHPQLHQRPLKALDIGGGNGILGGTIAAEFDGRVEYQNLDIIYKHLAEDIERGWNKNLPPLPANALPGDVKDLDTIVAKGTTYDAMFVLNFESGFKKGEYFRDRCSDEKEFLFAYAMQISQLYSALIFAQAALHLRKDGKLVEGGLFLDDTLDGRMSFFEKTGLRFWHDGYSRVPLSTATALRFAKHDVRSDLAAKRNYLNEFHQPLHQSDGDKRPCGTLSRIVRHPCFLCIGQ